MTSALLRRLGPLLLGSSVALGLTATAKSEELRIGFVAPTTGIFAQVGKDMVDGFQMYLDEHKSKLGGAEVKFIVEDEQGKPDTAVTKAKKLILAGQGAHVRRRTARIDRLCARAGQHRREDALHRLGAGGRRPHPARPAEISVLDPHRLVELAAEPSVRPMGLRPGLQEDRHDRRRLCVRLRGQSAASSARSRPAAARSSRKSGRRSAPRTSAPTSRRSSRTPMRSSR